MGQPRSTRRTTVGKGNLGFGANRSTDVYTARKPAPVKRGLWRDSQSVGRPHIMGTGRQGGSRSLQGPTPAPCSCPLPFPTEPPPPVSLRTLACPAASLPRLETTEGSVDTPGLARQEVPGRSVEAISVTKQTLSSHTRAAQVAQGPSFFRAYGGCTGSSRVPSQIYIHPEPQNVHLFGSRAFAEGMRSCKP